MPAHEIDCQYCGGRHWAFRPCEQYKKRRHSAPPISWGRSMEGSQLFGDRVESFEVLGGQNLVLRKEKDG
jgi:hypothetical protein